MAGYFFRLAAGPQLLKFRMKTVPFATRERLKNVLRRKWDGISFYILCV